MGCRRGIYESVKGRLAKELPWLATVDVDRGQWGRGERNHPMPLPAAYIEVGRIEWKSLTGLQEGDAEVKITLILELVQDTYAGAELECETLEELDREEALYGALQGWSSEAHSLFDRKTSLPPEYGEGWVKLESEWVCHVVQSKPEGAKGKITEFGVSREARQ